MPQLLCAWVRSTKDGTVKRARATQAANGQFSRAREMVSNVIDILFAGIAGTMWVVIVRWSRRWRNARQPAFEEGAEIPIHVSYQRSTP
jgi:hypothetical protein